MSDWYSRKTDVSRIVRVPRSAARPRSSLIHAVTASAVRGLPSLPSAEPRRGIASKVAELMRSPYPELGDTIDRVQKGMKAEENTFFSTVGVGLTRINKMFDEMRSVSQLE